MPATMGKSVWRAQCNPRAARTSNTLQPDDSLSTGTQRSMTGRTTMNAKELLQTYLSSIQNAEAAADFQFENVRIWIETPDRVFGE